MNEVSYCITTVVVAIASTASVRPDAKRLSVEYAWTLRAVGFFIWLFLSVGNSENRYNQRKATTTSQVVGVAPTPIPETG